MFDVSEKYLEFIIFEVFRSINLKTELKHTTLDFIFSPAIII